MSPLQIIILIIVGLVGLFTMVVLLVVGLSTIKESFSFLYLGLSSKNWQNTKGAIIVSQVKKESDCMSECCFYKPEIKYSYMVNNNTFYGDRISFNQTCIVPKTPDPAEKAIAKYLLGSNVTVFYDVNAPDNSSLEIGAGMPFIFTIIMGFLFGLFFLLTAVGGFLK